MEIQGFNSIEEDINALSNTFYYQTVDVKEFDKFINSPNRLPYATVVAVDTEKVNRDEAKRTAPNEPIEIRFEKTSFPIRKPEVFHVDVPISGANLKPSYGDKIGSYYGYIYASISLNWAPSNEPIDVCIQYTDSSTITAHLLNGGSGITGFNLDPSKSFYVLILNPAYNRDIISSYEGILSLWSQ